jgi:hypothetical protein
MVPVHEDFSYFCSSTELLRKKVQALGMQRCNPNMVVLTARCIIHAIKSKMRIQKMENPKDRTIPYKPILGKKEKPLRKITHKIQVSEYQSNYKTDSALLEKMILIIQCCTLLHINFVFTIEKHCMWRTEA